MSTWISSSLRHISQCQVDIVMLKSEADFTIILIWSHLTPWLSACPVHSVRGMICSNLNWLCVGSQSAQSLAKNYPAFLAESIFYICLGRKKWNIVLWSFHVAYVIHISALCFSHLILPASVVIMLTPEFGSTMTRSAAGCVDAIITTECK